LGYGDGGRFGKFYWKQVAEIQKLLDRLVRQNSSIDVDKYLLVCEQLGQEPDPDKMPLDSTGFPAEVQVAFFVFSMLTDVWDGMSGTYMGKDWAPLETFFNIYEIEDRRTTTYLMKLYENILVTYKAEEAEKQRKAEERKSKSSSGGKNYTHNIRG